MKSLRSATSRLTAATATAVFGLGLAAPAAVAAVAAQDDANPAGSQPVARPVWDQAAPLTISPSSGGPGTSVTVRSTCEPSGQATSEAFQQSITLREADNRWVGTGRIRQSGLQVGRTYQVTVRCTDGVTLSTQFTFTSSTPTGGAAAGFGGGAGSADGGSGQMTALAVGGGMAVAGTIGYVFLVRRRRAAGSHF